MNEVEDMTSNRAWKELELRVASGGNGWTELMTNGYWSRAWITQEFVLARRPKPLAGT